MTKIIAHDIGSLAKPSWRVKALNQKVLACEDIKNAEEWGKKLNLPNQDLLNILAKGSNLSDEEKRTILNFSSLYGLKLLEQAGLDWVWDGEQQRVEMYEYPITRIEGFGFKGHVRSFDNKYYRKASCMGPPRLKYPYHLEEFQNLVRIASKPIKIPITGAYTLMDWSYDDFYLKQFQAGSSRILERKKEARRQFTMDLARHVIYPNLRSLYEKGARHIQIDEPAATTKKEEIPLVIEALRESIGDLRGEIFFTLHVCFSDYSLLFPYINELEGILDEVHFEFANRDTQDVGLSHKERRGFEILKQFIPSSFYVGIGVIDVHSDFIEPPELVRDRIAYAAKILGNAERLMLAPDCGLRTRSWEVAYQKLTNMIAGRNLFLND